jgi:hypothetical protein
MRGIQLGNGGQTIHFVVIYLIQIIGYYFSLSELERDAAVPVGRLFRRTRWEQWTRGRVPWPRVQWSNCIMAH